MHKAHIGHYGSTAGCLCLTATLLVAFIALTVSCQAFKTGRYTIGPTGNYPTIDAAIAALNIDTVTGPVRYEIQSGTYSPSAANGRYRLIPVTGISAVNTVTFRPAPGATVLITGGTLGPTRTVFFVDGGRHYIFDGSNTPGGTSRNWTIRSDTGGVFRLANGADSNEIRNMVLIGNQRILSVQSAFQARFGDSASVINIVSSNYNTVVSNAIGGDTSGNFRMQIGVRVSGTNAALSVGTRLDSNEVMMNAQYSYGILAEIGCANTRITYNRIHDVQIPDSVGVAVSMCSAILFSHIDLSRFTNAEADTIAYNRIYLTTAATEICSTDIRSCGVGLVWDKSTPSQRMTVHHNMIMIRAVPFTLGTATSGIFLDQKDPGIFSIDHNTVSMGGISGNKSDVVTNFSIVRLVGGTLNIRNNIFSDGYGAYSRVLLSIATPSASAKVNSNYNLFYMPEGGFVANVYATVGAWLASPLAQDSSSIQTLTPVPFVSDSTGDLHILSQCGVLFPGESRAKPGFGYARDFDGELRNTRTPDIGADEGVFARGGAVTIFSPNGGEKMIANGPATITFNATRRLYVSILISLDSGLTWKTARGSDSTEIGVNNMIINMPDSVTGKVMVRVLETPDPYALACAADVTDSSFSIARMQLLLTSPNGGEKFSTGDPVSILWNSFGVQNVQLSYSDDAGQKWKFINSGIASAAGTYTWHAPFVPGTTYRVKIEGSGLADSSDANFTVQPLPIRLVSPNGGEGWWQGGDYDIVWDAPIDVTNVHIEYSLNRGISWLDVVASTPSTPGTTHYPWSVPVSVAQQFNTLVRVTEIGGLGRSDVSDSVFTLKRIIDGVGKDDPADPSSLHLTGIFPNPLRQSAELRWIQPSASGVTVRLTDDRGTAVRDLSLGVRGAGPQIVRIDPDNLPNGLYTCELRTAGRTARTVLVIVR